MANNRRIAKNSLYLAVRMLITLSISLYTSRVVLQQLGVTDFGVYSVVAGLSVIVAFITSSLTAAIQRYMNVEIGQTGGQGMQKIFAACCLCALICMIFILAFAESVGLWFLDNKLSIPPGRMTDARIVFQMSLVIVMIEVFRVPYNAMITAYERMQFYAYNSIVEAALKLTVVILLSVVGGNKLLVYMWLLIAVSLTITASYVLYCRYTIRHVRYSLNSSWGRVVEISRFAGLNMMTSVSDVAYQQGSSMILNIFFGVAYNATMGIVSQIKTAVFAFSGSVQLAANPQIVQLFTSGRHDEYKRLFMLTSRISFFLVLFIGLPIIINTDFILNLWLAKIPPSAVIFARLMILFCIMDSLTGPMWVSMQAFGRIAAYQIVISSVWLLCLPLTYALFKAGAPSYAVLCAMIAVDIMTLTVRMWFNRRYCKVTFTEYFKNVLVRIAAVSAAAFMMTYFSAMISDNPVVRFFISSAVSCITISLLVYFWGMLPSERATILSKMRSRFLHG